MTDPRIAKPPSTTGERSDTAGKSISPIANASQMPLLAGKFRVVRELGRGGMGAVYEVIHELTHHRRALKVVRKADNVEHLQRLLREASAAGRVANAHVVDTYDAGVLEDGQGYILMELLDGATLFDHLRARNDASIVYLIDLVAQACEGLHAAHEAGIVHRDVKPANLFVTTRGGAPFVKVVDFGVSKFDPILTDATELTSEGALLGTPAYMAPEQIRGHADVDRRADIYALGVVLYTAATGERPFRGKALADVAVAIVSGEHVPLRLKRPDLPRSFTEIVERAMARNRDDRFATCMELADALRREVPDVSIEITMPPPDPKPAPVPIPALPPPPPMHTMLTVTERSPQTPQPVVVPPESSAHALPPSEAASAQAASAQASKKRTWPLAFALGGLVAALAAIAGARATARDAAATPAPPVSAPVAPAIVPPEPPKPAESVAATPPIPASAEPSARVAAAKASTSLATTASSPGSQKPSPKSSSPLPIQRRNPYE